MKFWVQNEEAASVFANPPEKQEGTLPWLCSQIIQTAKDEQARREREKNQKEDGSDLLGALKGYMLLQQLQELQSRMSDVN